VAAPVNTFIERHVCSSKRIQRHGANDIGRIREVSAASNANVPTASIAWVR